MDALSPARNEIASWTVSLLAHALVFALLALNLSLFESPPDRPVRLAIDASVVLDDAAVQQRQREAERAAAQAARRREEAEKQRQRELDEQRAAAEQQRKQQEAARVEQQKREEAQRLEARKREAAAAREKAAAAERREQERRAEEQRRREAEIQKQKADAARKQAEREALLLAQLAAEEERQAAVAGGLLDQWMEVIRQRVQRNWVRPASARVGLECEVRVTQIPGGEIVDATVGQCNGDAAVVRSIENAVLRSSPLPPPPDPSLFERRFTLIFKPEE